jgi:hypothetical protein
MKHRIWLLHCLLRSASAKMFPETEEVVSHDVFQSGHGLGGGED